MVQLNTDWTQVEVITLINDGTGLGFGIIGGKSTGVVVKTILPGGVADRVTFLTFYCYYIKHICKSISQEPASPSYILLDLWRLPSIYNLA